jgi:hypothetical protein
MIMWQTDEETKQEDKKNMNNFKKVGWESETVK